MMKRTIDILLSALGLFLALPLVIPALFAVWLQDFKFPIYAAERTGKEGKNFKLIKIRSMVFNADKTGVSSTSNNDMRITKIGRFIRRYKLDELLQFINVLKGEMSLVGPRPNVPSEVAKYTEEEKKLLQAKPGITDISSIIFSDEGEILKDSKNPDADYNKLIRPWKSLLGLLYIENQNLILDIRLIMLTAVAIFFRAAALKQVNSILKKLNADEKLIRVCRREIALSEVSL
jgi:lipopolysaccharide/colanic/teichoic acid biosynthesis glycosyltransferase